MARRSSPVCHVRCDGGKGEGIIWLLDTAGQAFCFCFFRHHFANGAGNRKAEKGMHNPGAGEREKNREGGRKEDAIQVRHPATSRFPPLSTRKPDVVTSNTPLRLGASALGDEQQTAFAEQLITASQHVSFSSASGARRVALTPATNSSDDNRTTRRRRRRRADECGDDNCAKALGLHSFLSALPFATNNDAARRPVATLARSYVHPSTIDLGGGPSAGLLDPAFARPLRDIPPAVIHCNVGRSSPRAHHPNPGSVWPELHGQVGTW
ncbi:hypothetical protein LY76DRAFT_151715 [Colletotrichum caudatum]|nr:hypothetical protein LY76DRAFT_151715 [Colletotrichum caudatum]